MGRAFNGKLPLHPHVVLGEILPRDVRLKIHPTKICFIICLSGKNEPMNTYISIHVRIGGPKPNKYYFIFSSSS